MSDESQTTKAWASFFGNLGGAAQGPTAQVYKEWETWFAQHFDRISGTEQFTRQLGRALTLTGALKPWVEQAVGAAMRARGSADDTRMKKLEARVAELEAQLESLKNPTLS